MKFSIIIPVYNGERFIEQCFNSLNFEDPDIEVIVVNDGSTDKSKEILERYQNAHRFILVNKENKGVSHSRNVGIDMASGDYILFLDIDDFVSTDFFEKKQQTFMKTTDLVIFDRASIPYGCSTVEILELQKLVGVSKEEVLKTLLTSNIFNPCWGFAYKKELIEKYKIRFDETMTIGEDSCFVIDYIKYTTTVVFANYPFCINNVILTSAMHNFKFEKRKIDFVETSRRKIRLALEEKQVVDETFAFVGWNYRALICDMCGQSKYFSAKENLHQLWEDEFIKDCFNQLNKTGLEMKIISSQNTVLCYFYFLLKYKLRMINRYYKTLKNKIQRK